MYTEKEQYILRSLILDGSDTVNEWRVGEDSSQDGLTLLRTTRWLWCNNCVGCLMKSNKRMVNRDDVTPYRNKNFKRKNQCKYVVKRTNRIIKEAENTDKKEVDGISHV